MTAFFPFIATALAIAILACIAGHVNQPTSFVWRYRYARRAGRGKAFAILWAMGL